MDKTNRPHISNTPSSSRGKKTVKQNVPVKPKLKVRMDLCYNSNSSRKSSNQKCNMMPARDRNPEERLPKNCKHCGVSEMKLRNLKHKVEALRSAKEELTEKITQLDQNNDLLDAIMLKLVRPLVQKCSDDPDGVEEVVEQKYDPESWE